MSALKRSAAPVYGGTAVGISLVVVLMFFTWPKSCNRSLGELLGESPERIPVWIAAGLCWLAVSAFVARRLGQPLAASATGEKTWSVVLIAYGLAVTLGAVPFYVLFSPINAMTCEVDPFEVPLAASAIVALLSASVIHLVAHARDRREESS